MSRHYLRASRYHRQHDNVDWFQLTDSLKRQYKEHFNDYDIRDDIRRRKQRPNENFDDFYDAITVFADRLRSPMSEEELCETILRNLRTEIRHELLHISFTNVSELRRSVRKHEKFVRDVQAVTKYRQYRDKVNLAEIDDGIEEAYYVPDEGGVCGLRKLTCWNCNDQGHSYKECVKDKRIFCYGCGMKETYKPNCPNCRVQGNAKADVP